MKGQAPRVGRRAVVGMAGAALVLPRLGRAQEPPRALTIIGRGSAGSTSDLAFTVMEEAIKRAFAPARSVEVSASRCTVHRPPLAASHARRNT